jgi:hypothetical protein
MCVFAHITVRVDMFGKESRKSSNAMKAYANASISRQYFFDTTYVHLVLGLRRLQK